MASAKGVLYIRKEILSLSRFMMSLYFCIYIYERMCPAACLRIYYVETEGMINKQC